jgi:hypothetical protein
MLTLLYTTHQILLACQNCFGDKVLYEQKPIIINAKGMLLIAEQDSYFFDQSPDDTHREREFEICEAKAMNWLPGWLAAVCMKENGAMKFVKWDERTHTKRSLSMMKLRETVIKSRYKARW